MNYAGSSANSAEQLLALGIRQTQRRSCAGGRTNSLGWWGGRASPEQPSIPCGTPRQPPLKTGAPPKIVQERLGHSTIAITMDLYSHLMDGMEAGQ